MPADELGSIWAPAPLRVSQAVKRAGKELDREKKRKHPDDESLSEREHDSIELSSKEDVVQPTVVSERHSGESGLVSGSHIDLTVE